MRDKVRNKPKNKVKDEPRNIARDEPRDNARDATHKTKGMDIMHQTSDNTR